MDTKNLRPPLYFIAISPPANIVKSVESIKKELKNEFGVKHALKLDAHITVQIPFRMPESKEGILINKLQQFTEEQHTFTTRLDGFAKFAKNVIFIKVLDHEPYIKLHKELQEFMLKFNDLKSHEISSKIYPHLTLATRDLKRGHFPEIWDHFIGKNFSETFIVENLQLLKHNGQTWDIIKRFKFQANK
ncbi:2'-5' RNA ligase family protein [Christiangramia echinicola]|uniref:2'-5' RNA ligase family protein n=1 Tax=Christiangramia echinicola TaxID=279359 RepID=UPI000411E512|nr:2'-5' RNA ligase family protein [Christiangramia echinicola]